MAKKKSTRKKKCPSEELQARCKALIEDEKMANIEYSDLSDRAKTKREKKVLRTMANQEKQHKKNLQDLCDCNK